MKKYIRHVPQQPVYALNGVTAVGVVTHEYVLLEATAQPAFVGRRTGITAIEFALGARQAIRAQGEENAFLRGCWEFDDEVARAIKTAVEEGAWNTARAEALLPILRASAELLADPPAPPATEQPAAT